MDFFHDLAVWMLTVAKNWQGYASGTVLAFALEYGEKLWGWKPSKKTLATILIAGFLASIFSSWREEYEKNKLHLVLHIDQAGAGDIAPENDLGVFITASLTNKGEPTIAEQWALRVKPPNQKKAIEIIPEGLGPDVTIKLGQSGGRDSFIYSGKEMLYSKTMTPLAKGARERGLLIFRIPKNLREQMPGSEVSLICADVDDKPVEATKFTWGKNTNAGIQSFPGMDLPKREKPDAKPN